MKTTKNKYIVNFLISFYKFTHFIEKIVDDYIEDTKIYLQKIKNKYIKISKEYINVIRNIWIEYQIVDLLKISIFIFLILLVMFQSYYYGGMSHISYDSYLDIKNYFFTLEQKNDQYFSSIQMQDDEIEKMADLLNKCHKQQARYYFAASTLLFIGSTVGLVIGGVLTLVTMSK